MNRLQQAWVWLRRIGHCRGFGIQSPTDYRFVRCVVNEHWPYYAYAELGEGDDWARRKLGQLCFRLANAVQPQCVNDLLGFADYLHAGCKKAEIRESLQQPATLVLAQGGIAVEQLFDGCLPNAVLMVQDIWKQPDNWKAIRSHRRATIAYDLYYCGIVILDQQRDKQHYIVNF